MRLFPPFKTQLYSVVNLSRFTSSCHPRRVRPHGLSRDDDSPSKHFNVATRLTSSLCTRRIVVDRYDQFAHQCFFSFGVRIGNWGRASMS